MQGYIGHTDQGWFEFLRARQHLREANFWRPRPRRFQTLAQGEPFFFRLKSPINRIGGFGLFARYDALPMWRVWELFGEANGVPDETTLVDRVATLARRDVSFADEVGCIAIADCVFFDEDQWLPVPGSFNTQNLSGSAIDLTTPDGRALWEGCLTVGAAQTLSADWVPSALAREREGKPQLVTPRLGQGAFRMAVQEAYGGACAMTGEHAIPALEAGHIRPWSKGGTHEVSNGLLLRRDVHRLFDLGYMSAAADRVVLVSPRLRKDFANGRTYYALEGKALRGPLNPVAAPDPDALEWHRDTLFQGA